MVTNLSKFILGLCKKRYGQVFSALNFTVISVNLFLINLALYTGKGVLGILLDVNCKHFIPLLTRECAFYKQFSP